MSEITVNYIVESYCGYEAAKSSHTAGKALWLTTSPGLLEKLMAHGEPVASLEAGADLTVSNSLARAGYDFTLGYCDLLNERCGWREYADINMALAFGFNQCFFTTFYKARLLQNVLDKCAAGDQVICVGESENRLPSGLALFYNRFDTVFAMLAKHTNYQALSVHEHRASRTEMDQLTTYSKARRMELHEKLMSVLTNTLSSAFFKAFALFSRKKLFPFKRLGFLPWSKRHFYVYKTCELMDEVLPQLLFRGGQIGFLTPLPTVTPKLSDEGYLPERVELETLFSTMLRSVFHDHGLDFPLTFEAAEILLKQRLFAVLTLLHAQLPELNDGFERVIAPLECGARILTNALTAPVERLFFNYCAKKGVEVTAFEHGLVYGLSKWSAYGARHAGMLAAGTGVYHSECSLNEIAPYATGQRMVVGGLPSVTNRVWMRPVQRRLGRKILRVGSDEHVVMFVANMYRNNFLYGPHMETDFQNHIRTRAVLDYLINAFPRSTIVLKLYPNARYLDQWDWPEYAAMTNVRVVRDIDFRFIRSAADAIFVGTSQSTLGWCLGSGAPVYYLEPESAPTTFSGCPLTNPGIPEVRSMRLVKMPHCVPEMPDRRTLYKELLQ